MLNRRHIRVKVMQSIYAMHKHQSDNIEKEEKFLYKSIEDVETLYLLLLSALIEIKNKEENYLKTAAKKHLATKEEQNPNKKFVTNKVLTTLASSKFLQNKLEDGNITHWKRNDDVILVLFKAIKQSDIYINYMQQDNSSFAEDKQFVTEIFKEIIAPNESLYNYLEDEKLTWVDDLPLVNTLILKQLKNIKEDKPFHISNLYKDKDDADFVKMLFRKTVLNEVEFAKEYIGKTPNWDIDRIAEIDIIILKMAICELLKFPFIPTKVTINEYIELAKEYSTPKSRIFINGILDNLVKEFEKNNRLQKTGRGLL